MEPKWPCQKTNRGTGGTPPECPSFLPFFPPYLVPNQAVKHYKKDSKREVRNRREQASAQLLPQLQQRPLVTSIFFAKNVLFQTKFPKRIKSHNHLIIPGKRGIENQREQTSAQLLPQLQQWPQSPSRQKTSNAFIINILIISYY